MAGESFFTVGERSALVRIKAKPHAREDALHGVRAGELLVSVRAPAEKGRANEQIVRLVASALGLPASAVTLKSGASSSHKVLLVPRDAAGRLSALADPGSVSQ